MYVQIAHGLQVITNDESCSFLIIVACCKNFPNLHNSFTLLTLNKFTSLNTLGL